MRNVRWVLSVLCLLSAGGAYADPRPLRTGDADLLPTGRVRVEFGAEFLQGQAYPLSGLRGDLTRLGVGSVQVGVGEYAEFGISGVVQDILSITGRSEPVVRPAVTGNSTNDFGNLLLATKLKIFGESGPRPALSFRFGVELPNANQENGLGTDQTQFYTGLLLKKSFGRVRVLADLGLAILGSPVVAGKQTDPLTYGVGAVVPLCRRVNFVAEVVGRRGPEGRIGNENLSQLRAGVQLRTGILRWDLAGIRGLGEFDPDSGLAVGATYEFQAFRKDPARVRIVR